MVLYTTARWSAVVLTGVCVMTASMSTANAQQPAYSAAVMTRPALLTPDPDCPCIQDMVAHLNDTFPAAVEVPAIQCPNVFSDSTQCLPTHYGTGACRAHDLLTKANFGPTANCDVPMPPSWCSDPWQGCARGCTRLFNVIHSESHTG